MREEILKIVQENPRHYTRIIKNNPEMYNWILTNKKTDNQKLSAQIYSAVYSVSDICENNNIKKFDRWSTGFTGCGPASKCKCTKSKISSSVSKTKQSKSQEENSKTNQKRKSTMLEKYGFEYNSQRPDIKPILKKQKMSAEVYTFLDNYEWMHKQYIENKRTTVDIASELQIHNSTVIDYLTRFDFEIRRASNYSLEEKQIKEYIDSLGVDSIENDRTLLDGKEVDIYVPDNKIAFEINGLYWHSYGKNDLENKKYHLEKKQKCLQNGVNLIHITDYEWNHKKQIVKSMIKSKLGVTNRIYARKCKIVELNSKQARNFFECNHLNGFIGSTDYIGLVYDNEIVMCMSFGKNRFSDGIELHRMASIADTTVVGGASKILNYYVKTYEIKRIHTYCDFSHSDGTGYKNLGFTLTGLTQPNYFWTDGNKIISRYQARHTTKLKELAGTHYTKSLSEKENMMSAGYRRYWGCGNLVFEYTV